MRYLLMVGQFLKASFQEEAAYRANFYVSLLSSGVNLVTGVLAVFVLFGQVETIQGWTFASTLALLGVYLTVGALRGLVIGPSLEALAGMDGEVWSGQFDFTLLRPVDTQFLASVRKWRLFALIDLVFGLVVMGAAVVQLNQALTPGTILTFLMTLTAGIAILYAILLFFTALVFWSPGFLFTWVFNGIFQLARYPLGMYPGWLRLILTWIIPVGLITTIPAEALNGILNPLMLMGSMALAAAMVLLSSYLFHFALRRYSSASS
jgi:ABC-2 type transport system permease protein